MKKNLFEMAPNFEEGWKSDKQEKRHTEPIREERTPDKHLLYCTQEKRRGKVVTIVQPFYLNKQALQTLLTTLKKKLGTGGTIKNNTLELQGDVAKNLHTELTRLLFGYRR